MNGLDIALIVVLWWSAYKGWKTGLLQALLGLVGLVVAYVFALAYGQDIGHALMGEGASTLTGIVGIIIVFFGIALAFYIGARFLKAFLHATPLGLFDTVGGGLLGLGQGVLGFGLLILLAYSYPIHSKIPEQVEESQLAGPVQAGALILVDGIKVLIPSVRSVLDDLNIRGSYEDPPVVETIKAGADDAKEKLRGVVEKSRERLKEVIK